MGVSSAVHDFYITAPPRVLSKEEEMLERARDDLILFGKLFLAGDFGKTKSPFFHHEMGKLLLDKQTTKQVAFILPRGHGKTTMIKTYILHEFCYHDRRNPPLFYGWVSDSLTKSYRNMDYIRNQVQYNNRLIRYFGRLSGRLYGKKWTEQDLVFGNDCTLVSRSNARSIRGGTKGSVIGGSQRYHRIILDDIESESNTKTVQARENIRNIVTDAIYPSLDAHLGRLIFAGTPVHKGAFCQKIYDGYRKALREGKGDSYSWIVLAYKATQPSMEGGVLWNSYFPRKRLDQIRQFYADSGNLSGYYQEFELEPHGNEMRLWSADNYNIHSLVYEWDDELKQGFLNDKGSRFPVNCFLGSDPATDIETRHSDFSVIMAIAYDERGRVFVMEYVKKLGIPEVGLRDAKGKLIGELGVTDYVFNLYDKYHCSNGTVEDVGITRGVWQQIRQRQIQEGRHDILVYPHEPGGMEKRNKIKTGLMALFSHKLVYVRENMYDLRDQIEDFGPKMAHDDIIESLFFATRHLIKPGIKKVRRGYILTDSKPLRRNWTTL